MKSYEREELQAILKDMIFDAGMVARFAEDDRAILRSTDDTLKAAFNMGTAIAEEQAVDKLEHYIRRIEFLLSLRDVARTTVAS